MEDQKVSQVEQSVQPALAGPSPRLLKVKKIVNYVLLTFIPLFCIWYVEIGWRVGLSMYKQVYTMVLVAVVQLLVYLNFPANKKKRKRGEEYMPNILDIILGLIGFVGAMYVALDWENIYFLGGFGGSKPQIILGILFTLVVLESARRAVGLPLPIVAIVFIVYTLIGNKIPGLFHTAKFTINNAIGYMYLSASGIFGTAAQTICETVLAFTIFGCFLQKTNAGMFLPPPGKERRSPFRTT